MRETRSVSLDASRKCLAIGCLVLASLLSGCSSQLANIEDGFRFPDETDKGVLIGSLTYSGKYSAHRIYLDSAESERAHLLQTGEAHVLIPYFPDGDFEELGMKGDLFATELSAGKYAIRWWELAGGPTVIRPTGNFEINFEIKPGEALYIGNFHFRQTSWAGLTVTGAEVQYIDFLERDLDLFRRLYKNVALDRVYSGVEKGVRVKKLGDSATTTWFAPVIYIPAF